MTVGVSRAQKIDALKAAFGLGRHEWFAHSLGFGLSGSDADKDVASHMASAFGAQEVNRGEAGAVLQWDTSTARVGSGNGGWQRLFQYIRNNLRPYGTLAAAASAGATTIIVADPPSAGQGVTGDSAWPAGRYLAVGTGANGEVVNSFTVSAANTPSAGQRTITLMAPLASAKSNGDPVFEVPYRWHSLAPFYGLFYGINDLAQFGTAPPDTYTAKNGEKTFKHGLRAIIARAACGEAFHAGHRAFGRSTQAATAALANGAVWGGWLRNFSTVGNQITFDVPANYAGKGRIFIWVIVQQGSGTVVNATVDGGATVATLDTTNSGDVGTGAFSIACLVIPPQSAGRHVIVATVASKEAGANHFMIGGGIEAEQPSLLWVPGISRPANYATYYGNPANSRFARVVGTLTAGVSSGTTLAVSAPLGANGGAAGTIRQGEVIVLEEGTANEEVFTVTSADLAIAGSVTVTPAVAKTHASGAAYVSGMCNAAVQRAIPWVPAVVDEFGPHIAYTDTDRVVGADASLHIWDGLHYNDEGAALIVDQGIDDIFNIANLRPSTVARTSVPIAPYPEEMQLIGKGASIIGTSIGAASAVTEFPAGAASVYRWEGDLRRATKARFWLNHTTGVPAGSPRARLEYSIDGGTTWKTLAKTVLGYDTAIATASEPGQIDLTATATTTKWSGWFELPPDISFAPNTIVRLVTGNRASGTIFPTFTGAGFQLL